MPKVVIHKIPAAPGEKIEEFENAYVADGEMKKDGDYVIVRNKDDAEAIAFVPRSFVVKVENIRD